MESKQISGTYFGEKLRLVVLFPQELEALVGP